MKKSGLIKAVFERQKTTVREFAEKAGVSLTTMSNVLNGGDASLKVLDDCLRAALVDLEDCLLLPAQGDEREERRLLAAFRAIGAKQRAALVTSAEAFLEPPGDLKPAKHRKVR